MEIGPRTYEQENRQQHQWLRCINGTWYHFLHVKQSRTQPRVVVTREEPGAWIDVHQFPA